jgi:hypothetical protein
MGEWVVMKGQGEWLRVRERVKRWRSLYLGLVGVPQDLLVEKNLQTDTGVEKRRGEEGGVDEGGVNA